MRWLDYLAGVAVGTTFGFWFHDFWAGDLTGVGAEPPPSFDFFVPGAVFVVATALLIARGRRA